MARSFVLFNRKLTVTMPIQLINRLQKSAKGLGGARKMLINQHSTFSALSYYNI